MVPILYTDQEAPELLPSLAVIIISYLTYNAQRTPMIMIMTYHTLVLSENNYD